MCLAIPAKITEVGTHRMATVDIMGVSRTVSLDLTPDAGPGDYVLVHAGFALQTIDEAIAQETLDILASLPGLGDEDITALTDEAATAVDESRHPENV
jgi:hydrogenase expression/formation protein HypC